MTPLTKPSQHFTTTQFSVLTRATPRQLQWWDEQGWLKPAEHYGHRRRYHPDQVKLAKLLVAVGRVQGSPQIGRVVAALRRKKLTGVRLCRYVGWSREAEVFTTESPAVLVEFLVKARAGWWVSDVGR